MKCAHCHAEVPIYESFCCTCGSDIRKQLRISNPCSQRWTQLTGEEGIKHCSLCEMDVVDVTEMTREEVQQLLDSSEGRVCVRGRASEKTNTLVFQEETIEASAIQESGSEDVMRVDEERELMGHVEFADRRIEARRRDIYEERDIASEKMYMSEQDTYEFAGSTWAELENERQKLLFEQLKLKQERERLRIRQEELDARKSLLDSVIDSKRHSQAMMQMMEQHLEEMTHTENLENDNDSMKEQSYSPEKMKSCLTCKENNHKDNRFCEYCGHSF